MTFKITIGERIGRLLHRRVNQGWLSPRQVKHLANLAAAANRRHNRTPGNKPHLRALDVKRNILNSPSFGA